MGFRESFRCSMNRRTPNSVGWTFLSDLRLNENTTGRKSAPMTVSDVYDSIIRGNLCAFNSKDPVGIVRNALSRHSVENQHSCSSKSKHFSQLPDGTYQPIM